MDDSFYTSNAEWYAALVAGWHGGTDAALRHFLEPLSGTVVDIASGTGSALPVLRDLGAERLFAVEPAMPMRVGLMTTIAADPGLLAHTTVIPAGFAQAVAHLPRQWSAAVMLNAIGHLSDDDRKLLWATLQERLMPRGRFVVSLQPPESVTAIAWTDFGTVQLGEHHLTTRGKADPLDDTHVVWTMEWSLRDAADERLTTRTATHTWRVCSPTGLRAEAAEHGLRMLEGPLENFHAFELENR